LKGCAGNSASPPPEADGRFSRSPACWRGRSFFNPFCKNGEEIPVQRAVSVNLEARQPLFRPDGQPVTVWQKDENGKRVGNTPLPLKADYCLRIMGDVIQLVTA